MKTIIANRAIKEMQEYLDNIKSESNNNFYDSLTNEQKDRLLEILDDVEHLHILKERLKLNQMTKNGEF